jgi:hypothetical protein
MSANEGVIRVYDSHTGIDDIKNFLQYDNMVNLYKICGSQIGKEFIENSIENSKYIVIHFANPNSDNIRGFSFISENTDELGKYLYIDLICNLQNHAMIKRSNTLGRNMSGKDILSSIKRIAIENNISRIKLSAIDSVITYYSHLGYKLDHFHSNQDKLSEIFRLLKSKNNDRHQLGFQKLVKTQPGFYSERNQTNKSEFIKNKYEDGISMTITVSGGKKRKRSNTKRRNTKRRNTKRRKRVKNY